MRTALVHLGAGIGNIVLATPLISALEQIDINVDLCLSADYPQTAALFDGWPAIRRIVPDTDLRAALGDGHDVVIAAIPPFYWTRFRRLLQGHRRPPDSLFYSDEQGWYLAFATEVGWRGSARPATWLPIAPSTEHVTASTVVLAPGSKTGEMARKRWPHFPALADRLSDLDVVVVGTADDLVTGNEQVKFPARVRNYTGMLTLRETAALIAGAGAAVANDNGLAHVAAAVGTPTITLFGPTSEHVLGRLALHQATLRAPFACAPCWQVARFATCDGRIDCLRSLDAQTVEREVRALIGPGAE
jgi:ADP-heptose:LPS heptosyltransferase